MENNNSTSYKGELEINLNIISNLEDSILDDTSSIGSDLSFIQKEPTPLRKSSTTTSHSNRIIGGTLPEAGKSSNWSFNATTQLQQETEVKLTELSILKMHLDRTIVEKENLESIQKEHLKEIQLLQNEIKQLKLERVNTLNLQDLSINSDTNTSLPSPLSPTLISTQSSLSQSSNLEKSDENVKLSIDYMLQLQQENKELKNNLQELQLKYQQLLETNQNSTITNNL